MIGEVLAQHPWLWPLAWQSTACLAAGLGASFLLRRRPVRAHQLLLLSLVAAVFVPVMSGVVRQNQWGLFVAEPTVPARQTQSFIVQADPAAATVNPVSDAAVEPTDGGTMLSMPSAPAAAAIRWETALPLLWLAASTILLLRLAMRLVLGLCLVRRSGPLQGGQIVEALDAAKAKLGIERDVLVRAGTHARSPVIWCWSRRPVLLIPGDSANDTQLDWPSIICHELAHWKRRDHISGLFAELIACLLPWQPLSWLARRRLIDLSEEACDDWVIASGQTGTRYARTLLGLTPLGRAALVPAVVTTRESLAGRIRRIVENQCSNPRSGRRWTLTVVAVTVCLAIAVAFAQTRLSQTPGMVKSITNHGACVEQLAASTVIRGRVLDPNSKPVTGQNVRVTVLPMISYGVEPHSQGYFEVPWSQQWLKKGQPAYVMVRDHWGGLAGMVEIREPTEVVTIHLEPALTIEGRVLDPNGQPMPKACAFVSLSGDFKCRVPVAASETNEGRFAIKAIPYGHTYKLSIRAKGYQTCQLAIEANDRSKRTMDIGETRLLPSDPANPTVAEQSPNPDWEKTFQNTYRLEEGETLKLIKPPFMPERQEHLLDMALDTNGLDNLTDYARYLCATYRWNGQLHGAHYYGGSRLPNIRSTLNWILNIPHYDFVVPEELQEVGLPKGDWIVRDAATPEERLPALEAIIRAEMHRSIRFEKRAVERDTIVVAGRYAFTPLPGRDPDRLCLFVNENASLQKGETGSLAELFDQFADGIDVAIDSRAATMQTGKVSYAYEWDVVRMDSVRQDVIDKEKDLPTLLDNLAKQTGLQFKVEKQAAEVWVAIEDTGK
jgi:beta-lactamase regulating signal transducer with metallopeptidase domain